MGQLEFIQCLFNERESTCFSNDPKGTSIFPVKRFSLEPCAFFSINPLYYETDTNPTEEWHSSTIGRRADCNVTAFRNILVEMDKMPLEEQDQYILEIGMPYSTAVYSGGKSIHYVISLKNKLSTRQEYDKLVKRVYIAVGLTKLDITCKNPSRFSRFPGHQRQDTQKLQKLLVVKERISNIALENWLVAKGSPIIENEGWEIVPRRYTTPKDRSALSINTRIFLSNGANENWNIQLFKAAADLARNGWNIEEAVEKFTAITGSLDNNDLKTIRSAYKNEIW